MIPSRLIEIGFDWGRPPDYGGYRHGVESQKKKKKTIGEVLCKLIP